jgi:hypothetical protein
VLDAEALTQKFLEIPQDVLPIGQIVYQDMGAHRFFA